MPRGVLKLPYACNLCGAEGKSRSRCHLTNEPATGRYKRCLRASVGGCLGWEPLFLSVAWLWPQPSKPKLSRVLTKHPSEFLWQLDSGSTRGQPSSSVAHAVVQEGVRGTKLSPAGLYVACFLPPSKGRHTAWAHPRLGGPSGDKTVLHDQPWLEIGCQHLTTIFFKKKKVWTD